LTRKRDFRENWHSDSDTVVEKHKGTVTLYSRNIMAQWQWHVLEKYIGTVTVTL